MATLRVVERFRAAQRLFRQARSELGAWSGEAYDALRTAAFAFLGLSIIQSMSPSLRTVAIVALVMLALTGHLFVLA